MVGDLPFADIKPPENILFVCKLNPITRDQDLEIIFGRFGKIVSCEIIRDKQSGDSMGYAFIEYENQQDCEDAYAKMDNVLIDDRRIKVDFSQSVSKMQMPSSFNSNFRTKGSIGVGLEKKQKYRDYKQEQNDFGLVFERNHKSDKKKTRSRSRDRERPRSRERERPRSRDRYNRDRYGEKDKRQRSKDRDRSPRSRDREQRGEKSR